MTIAACYVSPEGIVLGADSTTTYRTNDGAHYFNHAQKLFQIGSAGSLGIVTWGLGGLGARSYRMLIAKLADDLEANPPANVLDVANRWVSQFWNAYTAAFPAEVAEAQTLNAKLPCDPAVIATPQMRTPQEEERLLELRQQLFVGFCIGGYVEADRAPMAFVTNFDPSQPQPVPQSLSFDCYFWGAPNLILRLIRGYDLNLRADILQSGKWNGTAAELDALLGQHALMHSPTVPIRDAVDFVHSAILSTIKALKFSSLSQICGGPIEIAAITADRPFRWVRHKNLDSAVAEGNV